jgi:hypothetical protein
MFLQTGQTENPPDFCRTRFRRCAARGHACLAAGSTLRVLREIQTNL